jgi:hypothetical protein
MMTTATTPVSSDGNYSSGRRIITVIAEKPFFRIVMTEDLSSA